MPAKITKLTAEQIARMPEWVDRWVKIGLSTDPADFDAAEAAALKCYEIAGLPKPRVVLRMSSPFGATLGGPLALALLGSKQVGSQVRSQVESQVGSAWTQYRGAQLWASWYAYISFFRDVCGWEEPALAKFAVDEILAKSCGWTWWHDDVVAISGRPTVLRRDGAGRLHADDGPALAYADGWSIFSWHGYALPLGKEWIIAEKSLISPDLIDAEGNAELRRIMLEVFGFERYIEARGAIEVASDEMFGRPRRLLSMRVAGEEIRVIDVQNGSLEPDGSRRRFFLGALRGANTPHEAVALSYGIDPKVYVEGVRT